MVLATPLPVAGRALFRYNYKISKTNTMPEPLPPLQATGSATPQVLLRWNAPLRAIPQRSQRWYLASGVIVVGAAAYGIIAADWSFAIVALLCGAIYVLLHGHVPELREIAITGQGVFFDSRFYSYNDLKGFWLMQTPDALELHLTRKRRGSDLVILTGNTDPLFIRSTLGKYLPEESDRQERLLDTIIRICKL